ncbi:MAG: peptide ABC transporter substrate-binding protein [Eubacteriales bacterium]
MRLKNTLRRYRELTMFTRRYTTLARILIIALALAVFLSACGITETDTESDGSGITSTDISGSVYVAIPENVSDNPLKTKNVDMLNFESLIFEGLIYIDNDGSFKSQLAETWSVDADGKTWTFSLRQGIKWHGDNGEFKASDVIFTLDTLANLSTDDSVYAGINDIIESYEAEGDYKVKIVTKSVNNSILYHLNFPIIPKSYYQSGFDSKKYIGTGAYQVSKSDDTGITLEVNESWWKTKPVSIKDIVGYIVGGEEEELNLYEAGVLDIATISKLASSQYKNEGVTNVTSYMTQYYTCLVPNFQNEYLSDVSIRKAIAYSIDRSNIISNVLLGNGVATDLPIPPDSWLYDQKNTIYEYNLQQAETLLNGLGYTERDEETGILKNKVRNSGITLNLLVLESDSEKYLIDLAEIIKEDLLAAGIEVNIEAKSFSSYKSALDNKEFDLAICTFYLDKNPDLSAFMNSDGSLNYSGYSNSAVTSLIENCRKAVLDADFENAYEALGAQFTSDLPHIPLYFRTYSLLSRASIENITGLRELNIFSSIVDWNVIS